jgi:hypothetical protein
MLESIQDRCDVMELRKVPGSIDDPYHEVFHESSRICQSGGSQ